MVEKIFTLNLNCVRQAKLFMSRFEELIKHKKTLGDGILVYNPSTKISTKYQQDPELNSKFNTLYELNSFESFYKNNFSSDWLTKLKQVSSRYLETPESKFLKELALMSKFSTGSSEALCLRKLELELPNLFVRCVRNALLKFSTQTKIPNIWFYVELGKLISSYFEVKNLKKSEEERYLSKLLNYYNNFALFKYKNARSFEPENDYVMELFKEFHSKNLSFLEAKFRDLQKYYFHKPIEHSNLRLILRSSKDNKIKNIVKYKLEFQYVELASSILDFFIKNNLLESIEHKRFNKIVKYFSIKNTKLIFTLNDKLPSLIPGESHFSQSFDDVLLGFDQVIKSDDKDNTVHESYYIESHISLRAKNILKRLKSENPWGINQDLLYEFLEYYQECKRNLDFNFVKQVFDFDIENLEMLDHEKYDFIQWCYDMENPNREFFTKNKTIYFSKVYNKIRSYKVSLNQTLIQGCIMSCFEKFYHDWFFDSRGRFYICNQALSPQGSKMARFLIKPICVVKPQTTTYMEKTLNSLKITDIINASKYNLLEFSQSMEWLNKPKDFFIAYSLLKDFKERKSTRSTYGLDATTSGIQMLGILKQDFNYLEKCGLLKSQEEFVGLYEKFGTFIKSLVELINQDLRKLNNIEIKFYINSKLPEAQLKTQLVSLKANPSNFVDLDNININFSDYEDIFFSKKLKTSLGEAKYSNNEINNVLLIEIVKFIAVLNEIPGLESCLYSRNMAKKPIMTLPYGSSSGTRIDQMIETYTETCISKGISFSDKQYLKLNSFFAIIEKIFSRWFKIQMPESLPRDFKKILSDFVEEQLEDSKRIKVSSKYCSFVFSKNHQFSIRRNLGIKNSKGEKTSLTLNYSLELDNNSPIPINEYINNITSSLIANIAHTLDKDIALDIAKMCLDKKIHIHTIHDCFRVDYSNAHELRNIIIKAYIAAFKTNMLDQFGISLQRIPLEVFISKLNTEYFVKE